LALSDNRTKKNIQTYTKTLNDLFTLSPVSYEYNGNYGTISDGKTYTGFVAQDLFQTPFASMVTSVYKYKYTHIVILYKTAQHWQPMFKRLTLTNK
jgi:hypothetical protein